MLRLNLRAIVKARIAHLIPSIECISISPVKNTPSDICIRHMVRADTRVLNRISCEHFESPVSISKSPIECISISPVNNTPSDMCIRHMVRADTRALNRISCEHFQVSQTKFPSELDLMHSRPATPITHASHELSRIT